MKRYVLVLLALLPALVGAYAVQQQRDIYISDAEGLRSALAVAEPCDTLWLHEGVYEGAWTLERAGTPSCWITVRAVPGEHAVILGNIYVRADYIVLRGLDITDPDNLFAGDGVRIEAGNVSLINNVIHEHCQDNGLGAWSTGPNQVYYGNILYRNGCNRNLFDGPPHNIYTQNDVAKYGIKTFDSNLILEVGCNLLCFGWHAYGEEGVVTGYMVQNNIFANSRVLHGGLNPAHHLTFLNNVFLNRTLELGYTSGVSDINLTGNTFVGGGIEALLRSGDQQSGLYELRNNVFIDSALSFKAEPRDGSVQIGVEGNVGDHAMQATLNGADYSTPAASDLPQLRIIRNHYEPDTYAVAVWSATTLYLNGQLQVYNPRDLWGETIAQGVNAVYLNPGVYVVRVQPVEPTPTSGG
jgi:hypothetical protein